ncbi:hypothetical protein [Nocardioides astragali]|uniref:Uncharacterized protein n=1 Tax=Nocardioides astragali TaxID=1776736 RepID=A0ABW2N355_9ACTN|nr:hypothetical protein [Nocardioides astragali]
MSISTTPLHPEELRAIALGWLARPAELFTLLLEHTAPDPDPEPDLDLDVPAEPTLARALAFPADLVDELRDLDLTPLAPRGVLHVHLHQGCSTASMAWPGSRASAR